MYDKVKNEFTSDGIEKVKKNNDMKKNEDKISRIICSMAVFLGLLSRKYIPIWFCAIGFILVWFLYPKYMVFINKIWKDDKPNSQK